jgi:hypothetical protein
MKKRAIFLITNSSNDWYVLAELRPDSTAEQFFLSCDRGRDVSLVPVAAWLRTLGMFYLHLDEKDPGGQQKYIRGQIEKAREDLQAETWVAIHGEGADLPQRVLGQSVIDSQPVRVYRTLQDVLGDDLGKRIVSWFEEFGKANADPAVLQGIFDEFWAWLENPKGPPPVEGGPDPHTLLRRAIHDLTNALHPLQMYLEGWVDSGRDPEYLQLMKRDYGAGFKAERIQISCDALHVRTTTTIDRALDGLSGEARARGKAWLKDLEEQLPKDGRVPSQVEKVFNGAMIGSAAALTQEAIKGYRVWLSKLLCVLENLDSLFAPAEGETRQEG